MPWTIMSLGEVQITAGNPGSAGSWTSRPGGRGPRGPRRRARRWSPPAWPPSRVAACISATTRPARRILAISSAVRLIGELPLPRRSSDGPDDPAQHGIGRPDAADLGQLPRWTVPLDQGRGLALVELEAPADGVLGVVLALDDLTAADVAGPVDLGRGRDRVIRRRSRRTPGGRPGGAAPGPWAPRCPRRGRGSPGASSAASASAWCVVRGQPSRMKPRARASGSARRSATISMMMSSPQQLAACP